MPSIQRSLVFVVITVCSVPAFAEVKSASPAGFHIEIQQSTKLEPAAAMDSLVHEFAQWWDASHSYSGKSENLSMDLKRQCIYETLPDGGFVRHMEILIYQPGKTLALRGGLGPLAPLGVSGTLMFSVEKEDGSDQTTIKMSYIVAGFDKQNLNLLSAPVNGVLSQQMERLKKHCDKKSS